MKGLRRALAVAGVGLLAVLATACGSGGGGPATISIGTLRAAATNSQDAKTQSYEFTAEVEAKGQHVTMKGSGVVATDGSSGTLTMDIPPVGSIEERITPEGFYLDMGSIAGSKLPDGKRWLFMSYDDMAAQSGQDLRKLQEQNQSSTQALEYLQSTSGDVEKLGEDTVNGASATHYLAHIDYAKFAEEKMPDATDAQRAKVAKLGRVPMDVWIDGNDQVVKMSFVMDGSQMGADGAAVKMTMTITGYDEPLDVQAPPADEVISVSELQGSSTA
jgi:hypothetical protein